MKGFWKVIVVAVLAVAVMAVFGSRPQRSASGPNSTCAPGTVCPTLPAASSQAGAAKPVPAGTKAAASSGLPRLVDVGAGKCIPCKMMAPILQGLKKEYAGKLEVVYYDLTEQPEAAGQFGVRVIPTQIFYDAQGQELCRHEGYLPKADILAKFRQYGIKLGAAK